MSSTTPNPIKHKKIQPIAVTMLLILFPAITLFVFNKGKSTGQAFYSELKQNLGNVPHFKAILPSNDTISYDKNLKGLVLLTAVVTNANKDSVFSVMRAITRTEQFQEEIDNLKFVTFDMTDSSAFAAQYLQQLTALERQNWLFVKSDGATEMGFKRPNGAAFSLVDTAGIIRRHYNIDDLAERRLMIEHLAIMPIKKKKNVEKKDQKAF